MRNNAAVRARIVIEYIIIEISMNHKTNVVEIISYLCTRLQGLHLDM